MKTIALQKDEKLLFGRKLYKYSSRPIRANIRSKFSKQVGCTERSFLDKVSYKSRRHFTEYEVDVLINLFKVEIGESLYSNQFNAFLAEMSDGDRRALENNAAFQTDVRDREEAAAYGLIL